MKVLIFNGSPRLNGNTRTALVALKEEIEHKMPDAETELIDADRKNVSGCINCDACKHNGGECVQEDDTVEIIQKIYDAEILIFGSPVYWWGITAKLKLIIDKMYSKSE
ncbi:MAG: flavodoxin family protein, partial [Eubacteriales bacterium]|nr:flavodoxin family protein [Eubacteriales bacterium]